MRKRRRIFVVAVKAHGTAVAPIDLPSQLHALAHAVGDAIIGGRQRDGGRCVDDVYGALSGAIVVGGCGYRAVALDQCGDLSLIHI